MTDNSAYRAAGTQKGNDSAPPMATEDRPASAAELHVNSGTTQEDSDINAGGTSCNSKL